MGHRTCVVATCVGFAREAGYRQMMLWTTGNLDSARRLYEAEGFALVDEPAHNGFGPDLIGQDWELDLTRLE